MKPMPPMTPMTPLEPMRKQSDEGRPWWPKELGDPSVSGSSNELRYVYFADKHRLAVDDGKTVKLYDTGDKQIRGFSSTAGGKFTFETDDGVVTLESLKRL